MYINTQTLEYPLFEDDIRVRFPNISFSSLNFEPPEPYVLVTKTDPPTNLDRTQKIIEKDPKKEKNEWIQTWEVISKSDSEIESEILSSISYNMTLRNGLLAKSDWTQLADSPLTAEKKLEWAAYRQSLRDFDYRTDPFNLTWPVEPTK